MDDNTKNVNQNTPLAAQADQAQPQAATQPMQPSASVGSVNKEAGPVAPPVSEFVNPTDAEPQISKELKDLGIEAKSDRPDLTFEHQELGMDHAGSNIAPVIQSSTPVKLPMTEEEIADKLKAGESDDSGKWLAGLVQKIIKALGL